MSTISGRNHTTNVQTHLNVTDDGHLKLDESGKLTDIDASCATVATAISAEEDTADNTAIMMTGGVYRSAPLTLTTGQTCVPAVSSEGIQVAQIRCAEAVLPDGYTNTQETPKSCSGGYATFPSMGYYYNGSTWDRMRGDSTNGLKIDESGALATIDTNIGIMKNNSSTAATADGVRNAYLNEIEDDTDTLRRFTVQNDLRYLRQSAVCFMSSFANYGTASSGLNHILSLWNNVGSGTSVYLYRFLNSVDNDGTSDTHTRISLRSLSAKPSGGSVNSSRCLKLSVGGSSASVECRAAPTTVSSSLLYYTATADAPGTIGQHQDGMEFEERIEIPPGHGVVASVHSSDAGSTFRYAATFFWFEKTTGWEDPET
jgi:hypothetical protein